MRVDEAVTVFSRGAARVPATGITTTSMGYDRDELEPGEPLPGIKADGLAQALQQCDEVVLSFGGKLGDTLLAFGAVSAAMAYLRLTRPDRLPAVRVLGAHISLVEQLDALVPFGALEYGPAPAAARTVLIGDRQGISNSRHEDAGRVLMDVLCNPDDPPCWSSDAWAYPSLPGRYFVSIERRLGIRLDQERSFMPILRTVDDESCCDVAALTVGVVTATSWPARKDYGLPRIFEALRQLTLAREQRIHALIVTGRESSFEPPDVDDAPSGVSVELLRDLHYHEVSQNLASCDLVIGNDTGLTHLAAATRQPDGRGSQVIGLYARHSHSKWRTGLPWHHALATGFSEKMHREDRCPVRDRIDDRVFGTVAEIGSIPPRRLAEAAAAVLAFSQGGVEC